MTVKRRLRRCARTAASPSALHRSPGPPQWLDIARQMVITKHDDGSTTERSVQSIAEDFAKTVDLERQKRRAAPESDTPPLTELPGQGRCVGYIVAQRTWTVDLERATIRSDQGTDWLPGEPVKAEDPGPTTHGYGAGLYAMKMDQNERHGCREQKERVNVAEDTGDKAVGFWTQLALQQRRQRRLSQQSILNQLQKQLMPQSIPPQPRPFNPFNPFNFGGP